MENGHTEQTVRGQVACRWPRVSAVVDIAMTLLLKLRSQAFTCLSHQVSTTIHPIPPCCQPNNQPRVGCVCFCPKPWNCYYSRPASCVSRPVMPVSRPANSVLLPSERLPPRPSLPPPLKCPSSRVPKGTKIQRWGSIYTFPKRQPRLVRGHAVIPVNKSSTRI